MHQQDFHTMCILGTSLQHYPLSFSQVKDPLLTIGQTTHEEIKSSLNVNKVFRKLYQKIFKSDFIHWKNDWSKACSITSLTLFVTLCEMWVSRISTRTCQTYCHIFFYVIFILSSRNKAPSEMRDHIFSLCRLCRRKEESQYILQTKELTYNITIEYCVFTRFFGSDHLWNKDH